MGDDDGISATDLTGDDKAGAGGEVPRVAFIVAGHAGEGAERGQADFNGEPAGDPGGESVGVKEPPTPMGLAWPGMVIGAADHGG